MAVQTYKNHVRWLPAFHFFAAPVLLINTINEFRHVYNNPNRSTAFAAVVAAAILTVAFLARIQALTAQDRLIRLEMRLRLQPLLPADLYARFNDLTVPQLVALRFASDGEMTELVRTVLKDGTKQADIKKMIKQWVPDYVRV
ncbi:MAG: DUF6526 family protein [Acidobacteriota bacterium]|nr:DUF6526 family protein [Acidobacteriota bacterium]